MDLGLLNGFRSRPAAWKSHEWRCTDFARDRTCHETPITSINCRGKNSSCIFTREKRGPYAGTERCTRRKGVRRGPPLGRRKTGSVNRQMVTFGNRWCDRATNGLRIEGRTFGASSGQLASVSAAPQNKRHTKNVKHEASNGLKLDFTNPRAPRQVLSCRVEDLALQISSPQSETAGARSRDESGILHVYEVTLLGANV